jgi:hypothetical protein
MTIHHLVRHKRFVVVRGQQCILTDRLRTVSCRLMSAPVSSNTCTASMWPAFDAHMSAVKPSYQVKLKRKVASKDRQCSQLSHLILMIDVCPCVDQRGNYTCVAVQRRYSQCIVAVPVLKHQQCKVRAPI